MEKRCECGKIIGGPRSKARYCQACHYRRRFEAFRNGCLPPAGWVVCCECGEEFPVSRLSDAAKACPLWLKEGCVQAIRECNGRLGQKKAADRDRADKPFRRDYCRQAGLCERYQQCSDLVFTNEPWPRERGEECYRAPGAYNHPLQVGVGL